MPAKGQERLAQRAFDEVARHAGSRHARVFVAAEPLPHIVVQADAVHVVVQRLVQRDAERVVIDAGRVDETDIIFGKRYPHL